MLFFDIIRYKRSCFVEKTLTLAMGQHTREYILYSAGDNHYTLHYIPPGGPWTLRVFFVELRRFVGSKNFFQDAGVLRVADGRGGVLVAEREKTTLSPGERG